MLVLGGPRPPFRRPKGVDDEVLIVDEEASVAVRKAIFAVTAVVAATVVTASFAWACVAGTSTPFVANLDPSRATAGTQVAVTGGNWSSSSPVVVRWQSATGQVLANSAVDGQGNFSATVTVPQASPGSYLVVAVQAAVTKSAILEVPQAVTASNTNQIGSNLASNASTGAAVVTNRTSGGTPVVTPPVASTPTGPSPAGSLPAGATSPAPVADRPAAGGVVAGTPAQQAAGPLTAGALAGTAAPGGLDISTTEQPTASNVGQPAPSASDERSAASSRLVSGDLWSGFAAGAGEFRGPSLSDMGSSTGPGSGAQLAVVLFASAIVALFGGFAFGELRRRRVTVSPPTA